MKRTDSLEYDQLRKGNELSSKLLSQIRDEQFYETLSTMTIQLAQDCGAPKDLLNNLFRCFQSVKSTTSGVAPSQSELKSGSKIQENQGAVESVQNSWKGANTKEQLELLRKMQKQHFESREKLKYTKTLAKYTAQKKSKLIPLLNIEAPTKKQRFRKILNKKAKSVSRTSQNYFQKGALQALKNSFDQENQCYKLMRSFTLLKTVFGHSMDYERESNCPLYNVLFDQSQKLIISGGEQGAIKIWSKDTGLLLSSLKGHNEYINKIEVTKCNKYLFSSAGDGIRFFQLEDMTTLGGWVSESIIDISAVYNKQTQSSKFMFGDKKNLYILDQATMLAKKNECLTKEDFSIYRYSLKRSNEPHILMSSILNENTLVLLGFDSGDILMFDFRDLFKIDPIKGEKQPLSNVYELPVLHHIRRHCDEIRELKWHSSGDYFVTGGKEGYCLLWKYQKNNPEVVKEIQVSKTFNRRKKRAFGCNFISFNCTQTHFVAGFMELIDEDDDQKGNGDVIVYSLSDQHISCEFSKDMPMKVAAVRGMDTHPTYPNMVVVCESTGRIILFDFLMKSIINTFELRGFHLLHPQFYLNPGDCRFTKDGNYLAVSTEYGSVSLFGYDVKEFYEMCPSEQFFSTDFISFTNNENLRPIPIEGDLQIDINDIVRGEVRNIRGEPYEKPLRTNFKRYWKAMNHSNSTKPIDHHSGLCSLNNPPRSSSTNSLFELLQIIQHNLHQAQNFDSFNHHTLEQIENNKQTILFEEREKQFLVFKKIIEGKLRTLSNGTLSVDSNLGAGGLDKWIIDPLKDTDLSHDQILDQLNLRGRRGGPASDPNRRLIRQSSRNRGGYQEDFQGVQGEEYRFEGQQQESQEIDYGESDSLPRMPRRYNRNGLRRSGNHHRQDQAASSRYNIRSRLETSRRHYNQLDSSESERGYSLRNHKRRNPAEDIEEMLNNEEYKNFENRQNPSKRRKLNRMREGDSESEEFGFENYYVEGEVLKRTSTRAFVPSERRLAYYNRGRNKTPNSRLDHNNSDRIEASHELQSEEPQEHSSMHYSLRRRGDDSSLKKKTKKSLGNCHRCSAKQATIECCVCEENVFCDTCRPKRGRDSQSKFTCCICIYLNEIGSAVLSEGELSEQYFRQSNPDGILKQLDIFVPQIGDEVRFFFQGYQEFVVSNIAYLNRTVVEDIEDYRLLPHIYEDLYSDQLLLTPKCKVKGIKFYFPYRPNSQEYAINRNRRRIGSNEKKHIQMLINLELLEENPKMSEVQRTDFWVFYIPSTSNNSKFLLREEIYQRVIQNLVVQNIQSNQIVKIRTDQDQNQDYQIISSEPYETAFPESLWKYLKIVKSQSKRLRNATKDEERYANIWQVDSYVPQVPFECPAEVLKVKAKFIYTIQQILENKEKSQIFRGFVDLSIFPHYRTIIPTGVCLQLILERINNDFYRSLEAIQFDFDLMVNNSAEFNGTQGTDVSWITDNAIEIRSQALQVAFDGRKDLLKKNQQKPETRDLNNQNHRSTRRKEAVNHEIGDASEIGRQKRSRRNQPLKAVERSEIQNASTALRSSKGRNLKRRNFVLDSEESPIDQKAQSEFQVDSQSKSSEKHEIEEESDGKGSLENANKRPMRSSRRKTQRNYVQLENQGFGGTNDGLSKKETPAAEQGQEQSNNRSHLSRSRKSRYMDSSLDSNSRNEALGSSAHGYSTRRSSRNKT